MNFEDFGLGPKILQAVTEAGYTVPTPIQEQAIPHILVGGDITGIAQTGTGKTAAFVLPMIHRLSRGRARARMPRTLILAPTRELAAQIAEHFEKYGTHLKLTMALLIGGVSFGAQDKKLMAGVDVLIATPGRMMDQFDRGKLLLNGVETLIIDEADRMLDMGFIPDIEKICKLIPAKRQTLMFSATMPPEIDKLAKKFQRDPLRIEVSSPTQTAETITQYVVHINTDDMKARRHTLRKVLESCDIKNGIVFCNRKREVDIVVKSLTRHGFDAAAIHGDLPQAYRTQTLDNFRNGKLKLLIASDVAARGLDIPDVSHVFNFAPPPKDEDYIHRIGRTGRAGRKGESFTIVAPDDRKSWGFVLKMIGQEVEEYKIDGLEAELGDLPPDRGGRSGGRGGRSSGRSGGRSRGRNEDSPARPNRGNMPSDKNQSDGAKPQNEKPQNVKPRGEKPQDEKPRRERPPRKRRDDDPILKPAPEDVKGFGDDVPSFLKR